MEDEMFKKSNLKSAIESNFLEKIAGGDAIDLSLDNYNNIKFEYQHHLDKVKLKPYFSINPHNGNKGIGFDFEIPFD